MKRILLLTLLGALLVIPVQAQRRGGYGTPPPPTRPNRGNTVYRSGGYYGMPAYFGLRAGWNVGHISSDIEFLDAASPISRMNFGVVAGVQVSPYVPVALEAGLLYSGKGGKMKELGENTVYHLDYLEVPVVAKLALPVDASIVLQPLMGFYVAGAVAGGAKDYSSRTTYEIFNDQAFRRFDAGMRIGCGFNIMMLYAELSYDLGLANISHDEFQHARTRTFSLTVGFDF